jgi:Uncharacterised protein family (UPF0014)
VTADVRLGVGLTLLLGIALAVLTVAGAGQRHAVLVASIRAAAQLALIAAALRGVFAVPVASIAVVAVMFTVATATSARRLRELPSAAPAVVLSCGAGSAITIGIIVGLPTLTRDVRTLVAVSGIVIGGTMVAATLTGRRLIDGIHRRREEIEAWPPSKPSSPSWTPPAPSGWSPCPAPSPEHYSAEPAPPTLPASKSPCSSDCSPPKPSPPRRLPGYSAHPAPFPPRRVISDGTAP